MTLAGSLRTLAEEPTTGAAADAAYPAGLWIVTIGFVWPLWLDAVGFSALPDPTLGVTGPLVGHLVRGLPMGGLFAVLQA